MLRGHGVWIPHGSFAPQLRSPGPLGQRRAGALDLVRGEDRGPPEDPHGLVPLPPLRATGAVRPLGMTSGAPRRTFAWPGPRQALGIPLNVLFFLLLMVMGW